MKILLFILSFSFLFAGTNFAQKTRVFDPTNARDGESVEYCHQHVKMRELKVEFSWIVFYNNG